MWLRLALAALLATAALDAQSGSPAGRPPLRERAEKGDADAQFTLGKNYEAGRGGLKQDFAEAARWYSAAAEQNDPFAQASLGLLYRFGKGLPRDYSQAYMWFTLAMQQLTGPDRESIAELRSPITGRMTPAEIGEAERAAKQWKPRASR